MSDNEFLKDLVTDTVMSRRSFVLKNAATRSSSASETDDYENSGLYLHSVRNRTYRYPQTLWTNEWIKLCMLTNCQ